MKGKKVLIAYQFIFGIAVVLASGVSHPLGGVSSTYFQGDGGNYNFGYNVQDGYSDQFRHESRDGLGRVVGSYGLTEADGRKRIVDYVADNYGFRATVRTNEPGTSSLEPADVRIEKIDGGNQLPPINRGPSPPSISRGQPPYPPISPAYPASRPFDDLHDDNLGTAYTQVYPQVPTDGIRPPLSFQNFPEQPHQDKRLHSLGVHRRLPLSATGDNLYLAPYPSGTTNFHQKQSLQPGQRGIGLISNTPSVDSHSIPKSAVQGVAYYPDPYLRLYYHPYKPQSGLVPNTASSDPGHKGTDATFPVVGFPVVPDSAGSSDKPNIILRAVPIQNGIQAVPVDATTGKVYTGSTGFPAVDLTNKVNPIDTNRASFDATGKVIPDALDFSGFETPSRVHPLSTHFTGTDKLYPTGTGFGGTGLTTGGIHPTGTGHAGPLGNIYPGTVGPVPKVSSGIGRTGLSGNIYPGNTGPVPSGLGHTGLTGNIYPGNVGPVPKVSSGTYPNYAGLSELISKMHSGVTGSVASATGGAYPSHIGPPASATGGAYPSHIGPPASTSHTFPGAIGPISLETSGTYPGSAQDATHSGPTSLNSKRESTVHNTDDRRGSIQTDSDSVPKFGTRLRPPQGTIYSGQTSVDTPNSSYNRFQRRHLYSPGEPTFAASTENKSTSPSKKEHR